MSAKGWGDDFAGTIAVDGGAVRPSPDGQFIGIEFYTDSGEVVRAVLHFTQAAGFMEALFVQGLQAIQQIHKQAQCRPDSATLN